MPDTSITLRPCLAAESTVFAHRVYDHRPVRNLPTRSLGPGPGHAFPIHNCGCIWSDVAHDMLRWLAPYRRSTRPIIVRDIVRDEKIDGISVPAGTIGLIPIHAVHRHRRYWTDPDRFDPGRFSATNPIKPTRYQFLPFGAGPRICIGAAFATIEATIMLATLFAPLTLRLRLISIHSL
jgi:hypothetical protein